MKRIHLVAAMMAAITLLGLNSCGDKSAQIAAQRLEAARQAYSEGNFVTARGQIDSIRTLYPTVVEVRRAALELEQNMELVEQTRSIQFEDSLLQVARLSLESCIRKFTLDKDTAYQDMGNWVIESQKPENNLSRSYLRAQVAEDGRLMLISTYRGPAFIHHKSIRVNVGDVYCQSAVSDDCYEYTDLGVSYEKCNLHYGQDGGIAAFIAKNRDARNMTLLLNGANGNVKVTLSQADREAIARLYELSELLLFIGEHQKLRDESARRVEFVRSRLSGEQS